MIRVFLGRAKFKSRRKLSTLSCTWTNCVGDRCEMKDRVESGGCRITELFSPIERRQIFGDEISAIPCQVLEITRPEIVDHREVRVREFFLQRQREIRPDEPGAASDDELRPGCSRNFCH